MSRFVVTSVTGWPITPGTGRGARKPSTVWTVLDSAYCFRPVRSFIGPESGPRARLSRGDRTRGPLEPGTGPGFPRIASEAERKAHHIAAALNVADALEAAGK